MQHFIERSISMKNNETKKKNKREGLRNFFLAIIDIILGILLFNLIY